jgi:glycosyltransferase involved in cell wall biosynthesis
VRIAFFGNICNNLYQIAKLVRAHSDIDVHLYVDAAGDPQQMPESDDPLLRGGYPAWLHKGNYMSAACLLAPWRSPLVRELEQYDVIVVSALGPMFAQFAGKPAVFLVSGGDLTVYPFPLRFLHRYRKARMKAAALYLGIWQRRGIRKSAELWSQPFSPFATAARELGVEGLVTPAYFPVVIDEAWLSYEPSSADEGGRAAQEMTSRFDFILFHPSRMMITDTPELRASGQWKQNDLLIRAFAGFLRSSDARRAGLVLIDRSASTDNDLAKKLIAELGIEDNVLWLQPPRTFGFTRDELIPLYARADVVADDFGIGWFGSIVLEGLALRKPVLCYVDDAAMAKLYPWHPLLSSSTVEGNRRYLQELYDSRERRAELGARGRSWVEQFHTRENAGNIYISRFRELGQRIGVQ